MYLHYFVILVSKIHELGLYSKKKKTKNQRFIKENSMN
jgi:hypothetical protein